MERIQEYPNECCVCGGKHNLGWFTWNTGEEVLLCERCVETVRMFQFDVDHSFRSGEIKMAMEKIEDEIANLMGKYFYEREQNFNPVSGDFKAVNGGHYCQKRMDKFARLLLENTYADVDGVDILSLLCLGHEDRRHYIIRRLAWGRFVNEWKKVKSERDRSQAETNNKAFRPVRHGWGKNDRR